MINILRTLPQVWLVPNTYHSYWRHTLFPKRIWILLRTTQKFPYLKFGVLLLTHWKVPEILQSEPQNLSIINTLKKSCCTLEIWKETDRQINKLFLLFITYRLIKITLCLLQQLHKTMNIIKMNDKPFYIRMKIFINCVCI